MSVSRFAMTPPETARAVATGRFRNALPASTAPAPVDAPRDRTRKGIGRVPPRLRDVDEITSGWLRPPDPR